MASILQGRLKVNTNSNALAPSSSYSVFHPETDTSQIVDFERSFIHTFNKLTEDAINIKNDNDSKIVEIPHLHVNRLSVDNYLSDRTSPTNIIVTNAVGDQDDNNIKETYATKAELNTHDFTVEHITNFIESVNTLIDNRIDTSGLSAFLPLIGGTINGNLTVTGMITTKELDSPPATRERAGLVKIGSNIDISNGFINIPQATEDKLGLVKLYRGRGHAIDGAVTQGTLEIALHDLGDICEGLYQKKTELTDRTINDEFGRRISEYYLTKEYNKLIQANKLNVTASESEPKEIVFDVSDNSYAYDPVEILKLNDDGENESITICNFDNGDITSFFVEEDLDPDDKFRTIRFNGYMYPETNYDIYMSELSPCGEGYISQSEVIPLNRFTKRLSINVKTENTEEGSVSALRSVKLFVSKGTLYASTGAIISNNWNEFNDAEKEQVFRNYVDVADSFINDIILGLDEVQVVAYTTNPFASLSGTFIGIPNKQLVVARGLIPTNRFVTILNADIIFTQHDHAGVRIAVSNNLENWYTFKENLQEWAELPTEYDTNIGRYVPIIENMYTSGILASRLLHITNWTPFSEGIAFCYLVTKENIIDECNIDDLALTVTMRGSWGHYSKGTYAYSNDHLVVKVYDNGDYKINYHKH